MIRTARLQLVVMLAIGGLGGWLVGSGRIHSLTYAQTSSAPPNSVALQQPCCDGTGRGVLLAKADLHAAGLPLVAGQPAAGGKKPNILVIFGDDIGIPQISAYTQGLMGYRTPNIDRIATEALSSPIPTGSRVVRPAVRPSSSARSPSAPVC
jgi:arylsulfatase